MTIASLLAMYTTAGFSKTEILADWMGNSTDSCLLNCVQFDQVYFQNWPWEQDSFPGSVVYQANKAQRQFDNGTRTHSRAGCAEHCHSGNPHSRDFAGREFYV